MKQRSEALSSINKAVACRDVGLTAVLRATEDEYAELKKSIEIQLAREPFASAVDEAAEVLNSGNSSRARQLLSSVPLAKRDDEVRLMLAAACYRLVASALQGGPLRDRDAGRKVLDYAREGRDSAGAVSVGSPYAKEAANLEKQLGNVCDGLSPHF